MRISNRGQVERTLYQISSAQQRMAEAQSRVTSGLRVNRPSDDPLAASRIMAGRTQLDQIVQYQRNISMARAEMTAAESSIGEAYDLLARAGELATQAANGTLTAEHRANIAIEVSQLLTAATSLGNTRYQGRYIFAGHQTDTEPFTPDIPASPTAITYNGDDGAIVREIEQGERLQANVPGSRAWPDVFDALIGLRTALESNDLPAIQASSGAITAAGGELLEVRSEIGARMNRMELAEQRLLDEDLMLKTVVAGFENVDMAEAIVELEARETAYQAALAVTGRTANVSLLNFLR
jgi:flagellar hook-associated protein 3 FlgL